MIDHKNGEIEQKLTAYVLSECLPRGSSLDSGQNLFESGIVDSAGLISFIGYVEKEFHVNVPDEDLLPQNFVSISAIAAYVRAHSQNGNVTAEEMHHLGS